MTISFQGKIVSRDKNVRAYTRSDLEALWEELSARCRGYDTKTSKAPASCSNIVT